MVTKDQATSSESQTDHERHSIDEQDANETSPLLGDQSHVPNDSGDINEANEVNEEAHKESIFRRARRDFGYAIILGIPIILLLPSIIFFITTLNLRANLPPSSTLETINNLTHRVSQLSKSLNTCEHNSTQLTILLHDEQQRVEVCRESEKRLAARVELAEDMLEKCQLEQGELKEKLETAKGDLGTCVDEKEELKRQMESGVFLQFLDMVGKMGTGGDSWVCSDTTQEWSHGYTSDQAPHPTITIHTWTSDLNDVQHSAVPLVFPPTSLASFSSRPAKPRTPALPPSMETRKDPQTFLNRNNEDPPNPHSVRIVGFSVTSLNTSGNNGWWRIAKLPSFAIKGGSIEFFAMAAKWYGSSAKFQVTVYWIGE